MAGALAAVSVMSSAMCLGASAYVDRGSWSLYANTYSDHSTATIELNYYSAGYRAVCTGKDNGGSYNYVDVFNGSTKKATITEVGVVTNPFYGTITTDLSGCYFVRFTVQMHTEDKSASNMPHNYGEIRLKNQF